MLREIHALTKDHALKLYLVLEERRYLFNGEAFPTQLPPVTMLGATTDYGKLHSALKRRWTLHNFRPATRQQLVGYIMRRNQTTEAACHLIVDRTHWSGAPWEGLQIAQQALSLAALRGERIAGVQDVQRLFDVQQIDELGLRWIDREVIKALLTQPKYKAAKTGGQEFVCYGASESVTVQLARVDRGEYQETIKPRLMSRGLLQVKPYYGQSLTDKAIQLHR